MSTITRCPNCHTAFRVTPAQLNAHDGQVRCGLCAHTFDGFQHLSSLEAQTPEKTEPVNQPEIKSAPEPSIDVSAPVESRRKEPQLSEVLTLEKSDINWDATDLLARPSQSHPLLKIGALILTIALVLQSVYQFRSYLAAAYPKTKPALQKFCALPLLKCDIPLWHGTEPPEVISSELRVDPDHANVFILTVVLRNNSSLSQDYPNLALTLTNIQGETFSVRILKPAEYMRKNTGAHQGIAPRDEVIINVFIDSQNVGATGFSVYPFYS
jgi:predicted Zn finger-like uncharacterized protein